MATSWSNWWFNGGSLILVVRIHFARFQFISLLVPFKIHSFCGGNFHYECLILCSCFASSLRFFKSMPRLGLGKINVTIEFNFETNLFGLFISASGKEALDYLKEDVHYLIW